jgi:hypothetical protein
LKAIGEDLVEEPFVYRYRLAQVPSDGLIGNEGTFTACSFWYVEALARSGQLDGGADAVRAHARAAPITSACTPRSSAIPASSWAIFRRRLSHLALISAAVILDRELTGGNAGRLVALRDFPIRNAEKLL